MNEPSLRRTRSRCHDDSFTNAAASTAQKITYLAGDVWNGNQSNLLYGTNNIAALTFAEVPLGPPIPTAPSATAGDAQVALNWSASSGATGYNIKRALTNGGPYTTVATAASTSATDTLLTNGTPYYYVVSATSGTGESADSTQASATPNSPYSAWATGQGLTAGVNDAPLSDPDKDGIVNLLELALGGAPTISAQTILPTLTTSGGNWIFEYNRSDLSQPTTTQTVEYGSDLTGWTSVPIPATSAGVVTITPGSPTDHVAVTLPALGTKGFVRLKITQ